MTGKLLRIDLTKNKIIIENIPEREIIKFVGGKGLAANILFRELKPSIDPLGEKNKLIFALGPINHTSIPGDTRFVVASKSPLTNRAREVFKHRCARN